MSQPLNKLRRWGMALRYIVEPQNKREPLHSSSPSLKYVESLSQAQFLGCPFSFLKDNLLDLLFGVQ